FQMPASASNDEQKGGVAMSDQFKAFLMSHKDEVMRLLKTEPPTTAKEFISEKKAKEAKDSSSESESSMSRRRHDSASSHCSSEGGEDARRETKSEERSRSRSRSHSPVRYRRRDHREDREEKSRSRSPRSRSRSRSRSSTPARYERQMRRIREGRDSSSSSSHYHRGSSHYHSHSHHQPHYHRGGGSHHSHYDTGARRGGFIRSRNMIEDGRDDPHPSKCLGVFGMPPWVREYDMRNMFEPYGEVDQLNVVINRHTGQCRGYGFVYYATVEEAKRARAAMKDAKIDGIPIRVDFSVTDQRRPSYRDNRD
ncbi:hypothetical protein PFISCL1PPCAC_25147, partial [Pristionchus fissidentatus]